MGRVGGQAPTGGGGIVAGMTARDALRAGVLLLAMFDVLDGMVDARLLLQLAMNCDSLELVKNPQRTLTGDEALRFVVALERRCGGEPVSRIVGWRGFYGRDFRITAATLDPRPDSETLIDVALRLVAERWPEGDGLEVLDIGTGSGCLLLTLLAELPGARGVGVDISQAALDVCAENALRLGVEGRCTWVLGRCFAGLQRRFPLIISNPPYIPTLAIKGLEREVRQFDPPGALDGGPDGLDIYREIAAGLGQHMLPGWLIFEAGDGQVADIVSIVRHSLLASRTLAHDVHVDLAGKQRCVVIRLQN